MAEPPVKKTEQALGFVSIRGSLQKAETAWQFGKAILHDDGCR
jgi:hypothetical protein